MTPQHTRELQVTRDKLRGLEELYAQTQSEDHSSARELTLRSLRHSINELKEEVARFESR